MNLEDEVRAALARVMDPELGRSLAELDMVRRVSVEGGRARVEVALTAAGCPLRQRIEEDIKEQVGRVPGIAEVEVEMTAMSEAERAALQRKLGGRPLGAAFPRSRVIAVGSGKGGVGKSTVTVNLAFALQRLGFSVGILDADIQGFSVPRLLGLSGERPLAAGGKIVPLRREGVQVISMGNFVPEDEALIWRGPVLMGALNQLIFDVAWEDPDFLVIDLPPGTGDIPLSVMQTIPGAYFLLVTTPQASASHVAGRLGKMAAAAGVKLLGLVENMAYFRCDQCGKEHAIFGAGETAEMAGRLGVPVLARLPLRQEVREQGDRGELPALGEGAAAEEFLALARRVAELTGAGNKA